MKSTVTKPIVKPLAACICLSVLNAANGQESSLNSAVELEQVIVTAQRRESRALDVPGSLHVFNQAAITSGNFENTDELIRSVPNAHITQQRVGLGESNFSIRGVGTTTVNVDQTIGFYIDDVPVASVSEFGPQYYDIEQVEVLRGPEGTLYGRNALGGVLHIKTVQPKNEQSLKTVLSYGSGNESRVALVANTPLGSDKALARINLLQTTSDTRIDNRAAGVADVGDFDSDGIRAKVLLTPNTKLRLLISGDYSDSQQVVGTGEFDNVGIERVDNIRPAKLDITNKGFSVRAEYLHSTNKLISISSVRQQDLTGGGGRPELENFDPQIPQLVIFNNDFSGGLEQTTYTQEFRLESVNDGPTNWIVGTFFQYNDAERLSDLINVSTGLFERSFADSKDTTIAVFGDISYQLNQKLSVSTGARIAQNKKELDYDHQGSLAPLFGINFAPNQQLDLEEDFDDISPRLVVEYTPSANTNVYGKISKGFKAGGYNTEFVGLTNAPYDKESIINYETGIKSQLFNRKLEAELSVFYMDWSDQQVLVFENGVSQVANAEESKSQGVELQLRAQPIKSLLITASAGYLDATFEETPESLPINGNQQPNTPDLSGNITGRYQFAFNDHFSGFAQASLSYQSSFYWDVNNTLEEPSHTFLNASFGIRENAYEVSLFGKNLTDENYRVSAVPGSPGFFNAQAQPGVGREIGIKAIVNF